MISLTMQRYYVFGWNPNFFTTFFSHKENFFRSFAKYALFLHVVPNYLMQRFKSTFTPFSF